MSDRTPAPQLHADCSRCVGLCCVLLPFSASAGFGRDKSGGEACGNLRPDDLCGIHDHLTESGWPGCVAFDCFGAGQQVTHVTYRGRSWRDVDDLGEMAAAFSVMRQLHEMLFHLSDPAIRPTDREAATLEAEVVALTAGTPVELLLLDLDELRVRVGEVLATSSSRRRTANGTRLDHADLAGRDLRRRSLGDADLRGAILIGADLRGVRLRSADLLGADLRGADVRGTDLSGTLFLTQAQANTARGDTETRLPARLTTPSGWS